MTTGATPTAATPPPTVAEPGFLDIVGALLKGWKLLLLAPLLVAALAFGVAWLMKPIFTARTSFLPPQQQASGAAAALSALGPLAALAGAGAIKTPADQYVSIMRSTTVSDRIIDRFKLLEVYDKDTRFDARKVLARNVDVVASKKDGIISVEVDDTDPHRAATIANQYVEELRTMTNLLALSEAQQRRVFFEGQLAQTRERLTKAQIDLQQSGFNAGAIKSEPRAAAEGYAKLRAEVTAAEVKLQAIRQTFAEGTPELLQQVTIVGALRGQLARLEQATDLTGAPDYVTKFRDYKYQETLFELFARQYEMARVDEGREGGLIQVIDPASPPEKKSKPQRALIAAVAWLLALLLAAAWLVLGHTARTRRAAVPA